MSECTRGRCQATCRGYDGWRWRFYPCGHRGRFAVETADGRRAVFCGVHARMIRMGRDVLTEGEPMIRATGSTVTEL